MKTFRIFKKDTPICHLFGIHPPPRAHITIRDNLGLGSKSYMVSFFILELPTNDESFGGPAGTRYIYAISGFNALFTSRNKEVVTIHLSFAHKLFTIKEMPLDPFTQAIIFCRQSNTD